MGCFSSSSQTVCEMLAKCREVMMGKEQCGIPSSEYLVHWHTDHNSWWWFCHAGTISVFFYHFYIFLKLPLPSLYSAGVRRSVMTWYYRVIMVGSNSSALSCDSPFSKASPACSALRSCPWLWAQQTVQRETDIGLRRGGRREGESQGTEKTVKTRRSFRRRIKSRKNGQGF